MKKKELETIILSLLKLKPSTPLTKFHYANAIQLLSSDAKRNHDLLQAIDELYKERDITLSPVVQQMILFDAQKTDSPKFQILNDRGLLNWKVFTRDNIVGDKWKNIHEHEQYRVAAKFFQSAAVFVFNELKKLSKQEFLEKYKDYVDVLQNEKLFLEVVNLFYAERYLQCFLMGISFGWSY